MQAFSAILRGLSDPSLHPGRKLSLHHRAVRICRSQKWAAKLEQLPNMEVHPYPEVRVCVHLLYLRPLALHSVEAAVSL